MATTKIWPVKGSLKRLVDYASNPEKTTHDDLAAVIEYAMNGEKTTGDNEKACYVTGVNCFAETALEEMLNTQQLYGKTGGNVAYHCYQSFKPGEVSPEQCHQLGIELARRMWGDRYQVLVATHLDRDHLHNHLVCCSVSFIDGKKFNDNKGAYARLRKLSDEICLENGLSVIERPLGKTPRQLHFAEKKGEPTRYNLMRKAIDEAISLSADMRTFMNIMKHQGYIIGYSESRKYPTIRSIYSKKSTRLFRLGPEYDLERIEQRVYENRLEDVIRKRDELGGGYFHPAVRHAPVKVHRKKLRKISGIYALYDHYANSQYNNMTLRELYPIWLHYKSLYLRKASITRFESDWARFYDKSPIVDVPIRTLTKNQLEEWVREIAAVNKMDKQQYANFVTILKQELEYAEEKDLIEVSPFRQVKVKSRQLRSKKVKPDFTQVYSQDELDKLKEMARNDYEQKTFTAHPLAPLAIIFMFLTGLRIGEVVGLKFSDIYETKMLIQRMVQYPDGEIIDDTKGDFGPRFVLLIPEAVELIETARKYKEERKIRNDFVFCTTDRPILTYWSIQRAFRKYCADMNIVTKSAHKARKTYISACIDEGINAKTVAQQVGHKDVRTTLNNYYYDRRSENEQIMQLSKALSK